MNFHDRLKPHKKYRQVITPVSGLHILKASGIYIWPTSGKIGAAHRITISVDQKMAEVTAKYTRFPTADIFPVYGH